MGKVIAIEHLTLDGVMQGPGHQDEDPRDGFELGGWGARAQDPLMLQVMGAHMTEHWSLLVGRTTYVRFASFWPKQSPNPFTDALDKVQKYVVSNTLAEPLAWQHSSLLAGDGARAVARLKEDVQDNLVIFGSGVLVRSLMQRNLVDEFVLVIHPLMLGKGRRLFTPEVNVTRLQLSESFGTPTGAFIGVYRPAPE